MIHLFFKTILPCLLFFFIHCDNWKGRFLAHDGVDAYKQGNFLQAISLFDKAVQQNSSTSVIWRNRAIAHLEQYKKNPKGGLAPLHAQEAMTSLKTYLSFPLPLEKRQKAQDQLLWLFRDTKNYHQALSFLQSELLKKTKNPWVLTYVSQLAYECGKPKEAQDFLEKRITATPSDPFAYQALVLLYQNRLTSEPSPSVEEQRNMLSQAITLSQKAVSLAPNNTDFLQIQRFLWSMKVKRAIEDEEQQQAMKELQALEEKIQKRKKQENQN